MTSYNDQEVMVRPWPVYWSAIWVGVLAALAMGVTIGLAGGALGAHQEATQLRNGMGLGTLVFSVAGSFFSFVVGGWVATRVAGFRHAESAALHGAIVWLVSIPILLVLVTLGAGTLFGAWAGGLAGTPIWAQQGMAMDPRDARNAALGAITMLLLGLMGGVSGAWLAVLQETTAEVSEARPRPGRTAPQAH